MRQLRVGAARPFEPSRLMALAAIGVVAVVLIACGSSKPKYCSDRSDLESSVNDLGNIKVAQSGGVAQLKTQLQKVATNAQALQSSAKSDFPSQSSAIVSSTSALQTAVNALPPSPTPQQLAAVAVDVKSVGTATQSFKSATDSKCS